MTRVVRGTDGSVDVDPTGKRSGRGAYVCRQPTCWEQALKRRALDRALKTVLDEPQRERLRAFAASVVGAAVAAGTGSEEEHESETSE